MDPWEGVGGVDWKLVGEKGDWEAPGEHGGLVVMGGTNDRFPGIACTLFTGTWSASSQSWEDRVTHGVKGTTWRTGGGDIPIP